MKQVCAGREMAADFAGAVGSAAATGTGAVIAVPGLKPIWATEQIEQSWCGLLELSG